VNGPLSNLFDCVDRADVHGFGAQSFFPRIVWLLADVIHTVFVIGPKIPWGDFRTDTTTDTPIVDMVSGCRFVL
jgi:hypothetical protein